MGFDGVELFSKENNINMIDLPEERCRAIASKAKELQMRISAHPWVDWEYLPEEELIQRFYALIKRCIDMNIKEINLHLHFFTDRKQGMN